MHTFLNKSTLSWKDSEEDVLQSTVSFVSAIVSQSENYPNMVTVKLSFSLTTFGMPTETCLTLNREPKRHCQKFTWLVTFLQQYVKL